ncbi:MAG TPA: response regulator transcription factor [Candidatus Paceibacterota bacterium]
MKILLIEDDGEIRDFIKNNLTEDTFTVDIATDGQDGSFLARTNHYDAIILDYSLPIKNGVDVCEEIRASGVETPIIFLTIYGDIKRKVQALEAGADDYMIKPFSLEELRARINAMCRRPRKIESPLLMIDDLVLDTQKRTVARGETNIYLTRKTYDLLEYLMKNKNTVLSRGAIMEYVWNSESDPFSNTVEAHISNLRKKINIAGKKDILKNIAGRGYIVEG